MYSQKDLTTEIEQVIEEMQSAKMRDLHPDWITQAVLARHPDVDGADSDFYTACSRPHVRGVVAQRLNRFKAKADVEPDRQIVLAGFERLQERYLVDVGGAQVARHVDELTDAQLEAKEAELIAMGMGCYQHADEIRRFRMKRRSAA